MTPVLLNLYSFLVLLFCVVFVFLTHFLYASSRCTILFLFFLNKFQKKSVKTLHIFLNAKSYNCFISFFAFQLIYHHLWHYMFFFSYFHTFRKNHFKTNIHIMRECILTFSLLTNILPYHLDLVLFVILIISHIHVIFAYTVMWWDMCMCFGFWPVCHHFLLGRFACVCFWFVSIFFMMIFLFLWQILEKIDKHSSPSIYNQILF